MKHSPFPISFLTLLLGLMLPFASASAQVPQPPCVISGGMSAIWSTGCASSADVGAATTAINKMSETIVEALQKQVTKPLGEQMNANQMYNDQQKLNENHQKQVLETGKKTADATLTAIARYKPTQQDCVSITSQKITEYYLVRDKKRAVDLTNPDVGYMTTGYPGGSSQAAAAVSKSTQDAVKNPNDKTKAADNPNEAQVKRICDTPECYNKWLDHKITNILILSVGDRAPWNAILNSQMADYFNRRREWEDARSAARATVTSLLPNAFKRLDYYKKAEADYAESMTSKDTNAAKEWLELEYPNSSKIGLSYYELQQAELNAIRSSTKTFNSAGNNEYQNQRDAATELAYRNKLQNAKEERKEFEQALKQLGVPPPAVSASALSITQ